MEKTVAKKENKPKIGITIGDFNGIGPEVIIKVLSDIRITNLCTPIVYGSGKILTKYKRLLELENFNYHQYNPNSYLNEKKPNVINCWHDNIEIEPGRITQTAGISALKALEKSSEDLESGFIDAVVTAPISKENIQSDEFKFPGHTEYYESKFGDENSKSLMMMVSENLKVAMVTGHVPLSKVKSLISKEKLRQTLKILLKTLKTDFGIQKPKIAVLGLNPHAGENGLLGDHENQVITPVISDFKNRGNLVYGPFSADGFFGAMSFKKYDAVLAMYHDQGLLPFKILAFDEGVNYTAGLKVVRTSPDHGTAYNIAGKNLANPNSIREAIYLACDIVKARENKVESGIRVNKEIKERDKDKDMEKKVAE
ncbi:MAG: 4-hydroxythreonine-4-phosphate dehydrogenase PdxA [Thalassobius sp.]|nr:4-hydroxythreonine-4-phosphate dehydrogenase PdxA [Thalassovita sp.]